MSKIIVFSDTHMTVEPRAGRPEPAARLRAGLAHARRHHPDAACTLFCGDLTHRGDRASYERLRGMLDPEPRHTALLIGNHDHRATFRAVFPEAPVDPADFVQRVIDLPDIRLVTLDTTNDLRPGEEGYDAGELCAARLDWMEARLAEAADRPCILFMHHPPHDTGFPAMDAIKLKDGAAFHDRLARHRNVRLLVCGHIHRTISGCHRGLPFAIFKSTVGQMPMDLVSLDSSIENDEPAAYGILLITPDGVLVHTEDYEIAGP